MRKVFFIFLLLTNSIIINGQKYDPTAITKNTFIYVSHQQVYSVMGEYDYSCGIITIHQNKLWPDPTSGLANKLFNKIFEAINGNNLIVEAVNSKITEDRKNLQVCFRKKDYPLPIDKVFEALKKTFKSDVIWVQPGSPLIYKGQWVISYENGLYITSGVWNSLSRAIIYEIKEKHRSQLIVEVSKYEAVNYLGTNIVQKIIINKTDDDTITLESINWLCDDAPCINFEKKENWLIKYYENSLSDLPYEAKIYLTPEIINQFK